MRDYQWKHTRLSNAFCSFLILLFLVYQTIMSDKIHVFPFPNDFYLMFVTFTFITRTLQNFMASPI